MAYSEKVLDHYENPRNVGSLDKSDPNVGTGLVGAPACGDVMKLQLKISDSPTALVEIEKLQAKREADGKPRALGLRVGIRGGGCTGFGYLFEWCDTAPRATDRVFEFDGGKVKLFCDPKSLLYLDGTT